LLLTIGIPVFNEERHIGNTIKSIVNQLSTVEQSIRLIVVDNASTDSSIKVIKEMQDTTSIANLEFQVYSNLTNMGFNYNCDRIIDLAESEFLWILGAQDAILKGGPSEVIMNLNSDTNQLVVNAEVWDEATEQLANLSIYGKGVNETYSSVLDFFRIIGGPCRAISLNIMRTEALAETLTHPQISHYWGLYERQVKAPFVGSAIGISKYIGRPIVRIMIEKDGWQALSEDDFGTSIRKNAFPGFNADLEMAEIANVHFADMPEIRNSIAVWRDPFGIVRTITTAKCNGIHVDLALIKRTTRIYSSSPWYWFIGLPFLLIPRKLLNAHILEIGRSGIHLLRRMFHAPAK
jgi:glycosyltransferase involved in cell wall biosynthesis